MNLPGRCLTVMMRSAELPVMTLKHANILGVVHWQYGEFEEAIRVFEKVQADGEGVWKPDNPQRIESLLNVAINYREAKRFDSAIHVLEEMLTLPLPAPMAQACRNEWLEDLMLGRRVEKFEDWTNGEIQRQRDAKVPPPILAGQLVSAGIGFVRMEQWDKAEPLLRECVELRRKNMPGTWNTFYAISALGEVQFGWEPRKKQRPCYWRAGKASNPQRFRNRWSQAARRNEEGSKRIVG
jgi:tetratricopeptide (TPR) repeat protein